MSTELDVWPYGDLSQAEREKLTDKIDALIGEGSPFHETHHIYAQGIGPETIKVPVDLMTRVTRVHGVGTDPYIAYCLSPVDVFIGKAVAKRAKDKDFCEEMLVQKYVSIEQVLELCEKLPEDVDKRIVKATIRRWGKSVGVCD